MSHLFIKVIIFEVIFLSFTLSLLATKQDKTSILKLPQHIIFPSITNKTCYDSVFIIPVSVSSGLPVVLTAKSGSVLISGNIITVTGPGTVIIEATQPGDSTFDAAAPVTNIFEVSSSFFSNNQTNFSIKVDTSLCVGEAVNFIATSIDGVSYTWSGSQNLYSTSAQLFMPDIDLSHAGKLNLKVFESKCVFVDKDFTIVVNSKPYVSITGISDKIFTGSTPFQIQVFPQGGKLDGNGIVNNQFIPSMAGLGQHTIIYTFIDSKLCSNNGSIYIEVFEDTVIVPPKEINIYELITIRQGSKHTTWIINNIEKYIDNEVFVYNNWGNLVYSARNYNNENGWDASGMPGGAYLYVVKLNENSRVMKGTLFVDK